ncbi:MAG: class I SAM-dependent methyltransferase [Acidobacteriota bacterium]
MGYIGEQPQGVSGRFWGDAADEKEASGVRWNDAAAFISGDDQNTPWHTSPQPTQFPTGRKVKQPCWSSFPQLVTRVLDLGSGDGRLLTLVELIHPNAQGIALDVSDTMLDRLRALCRSSFSQPDPS